MSVSDVFITDAEQSDLKPMNDMEGMLHHPYQSLRSLPGSNRMDVRIVSFNNPGFGQRNEVQIPSMDLIPHEMYVEFNIAAVAGTASPTFQPTPTWLTQQGVDLNFKEVSIYNMSEAECLSSAILDEEDVNWHKKQNSYGFNDPTAATNAHRLYLPLNVVCTQVLSKIGPLSAYASNDWSISVDLRPLIKVISGGDGVAPTGGAVTSMRLIILGSKAPTGEVALTREALMKNGIVFNFLRSNYIRDTIPDNEESASTYSKVYSSVVGAVSHVRLLLRNKASWDTDTATTKNNVDWEVFNGVSDLISGGKTSNPFEIWGQQLPQEFVRNFFSAKSIYGAGKYISTDLTTVDVVDTGIFDIAFAESKGDIEFGISTGSYPVKNDLQFDLAFASDTSQANYLDAVIYTHVRGVITAGLANVNLSA